MEIPDSFSKKYRWWIKKIKSDAGAHWRDPNAIVLRAPDGLVWRCKDGINNMTVGLYTRETPELRRLFYLNKYTYVYSAERLVCVLDAMKSKPMGEVPLLEDAHVGFDPDECRIVRHWIR